MVGFLEGPRKFVALIFQTLSLVLGAISKWPSIYITVRAVQFLLSRFWHWLWSNNKNIFYVFMPWHLDDKLIYPSWVALIDLWIVLQEVSSCNILAQPKQIDMFYAIMKRSVAGTGHILSQRTNAHPTPIHKFLACLLICQHQNEAGNWHWHCLRAEYWVTG